MHRIFLLIILNCSIYRVFSQDDMCNILDSIASLEVETNMNFDGLFEKFYTSDDLIAINQLDSISNILKKAGFCHAQKGFVKIQGLPYEVYTLKCRNKRKRDAFLVQFDQHLLNYQNYWVLELFLKPGILVYENRRRNITVLRSNQPDQLLEIQKCLGSWRNRFIDQSILR